MCLYSKDNMNKHWNIFNIHQYLVFVNQIYCLPTNIYFLITLSIAFKILASKTFIFIFSINCIQSSAVKESFSFSCVLFTLLYLYHWPTLIYCMSPYCMCGNLNRCAVCTTCMHTFISWANHLNWKMPSGQLGLNVAVNTQNNWNWATLIGEISLCF